MYLHTSLGPNHGVTDALVRYFFDFSPFRDGIVFHFRSFSFYRRAAIAGIRKKKKMFSTFARFESNLHHHCVIFDRH